MTYFVNLRAGPFGAVCSAYVIEGPVTPGAADARTIDWGLIPALVRDRHILMITHGFNVSYAEGLRSLSRLEAAITPAREELLLGVLWPGDWIIPAISYPFEESVSTRAGDMLADFCNHHLAGAASIAIASHSMGARLILRAVARCDRRIRRVCLAAGAVNDDCLSGEFAAAAANCDDMRTLSSMEDTVLEFAFPPGDFIADILLPDHRQFRRALGRQGPRYPYPLNVRPAQIKDAALYRHSDYLPPSSDGWVDGDPNERWRRSTAFIVETLRGEATAWP